MSNRKQKQWSPVNVSKAAVSTAISNYLEGRGYRVNRKRGISLNSSGATVLASR